MSAIAEKLSQAGPLDNMIRQQNSVVDIFLHGVNFIQMAVGFVHLHKSLDASIQRTFIGCLQFEKVHVLVAAPRLVTVFRHGR
jgi:hypothetical protein